MESKNKFGIKKETLEKISDNYLALGLNSITSFSAGALIGIAGYALLDSREPLLVGFPLGLTALYGGILGKIRFRKEESDKELLFIDNTLGYLSSMTGFFAGYFSHKIF
ncbi:MAG: hypothetical protein ACP5OG_00030 [Candidatus Nanoarchaeia archaeon]